MTKSSETPSRIFDAEAVRRIARAGDISADQAQALADRFEPVGQHFRRIALSLPTNLSIGPSDRNSTTRQRWLHTSVLDPTAVLLRALEERPLLSGWPDQVEFGDSELEQLGDLLVKLQAFAGELIDQLAARSDDRSTINAEVRFDLVSQLASECGKGGLPITRGYHTGTGNTSAAAQVISLACGLITGTSFSIDHHLRDYLKLNQAK